MTTPTPAEPMDTGDIAAVEEDQRGEDATPDNVDADDDLADVEDGDVVEIDTDDAGG